MRVLLDENVPEALISDLVEHDCDHVITLGWGGIKNGKLLKLAEDAGFRVLITLDKGIPNQQNMSGRRIAIFVMRPNGQGLNAVRSLFPEILIALTSVQDGEVRVFTNRPRD